MKKQIKYLNKNLLKPQRGITLIALVITIIVLLILAGVSLSLISGGDGILSKAGQAVDATNEGKIAEEIELAISQTKADYYQERYVDKTTQDTYADWLKNELKSGITTANGTIKFQENSETENVVNFVIEYKSEKNTKIGLFNAKSGDVLIPVGQEWVQSGTIVTNGTIILKVGQSVTGYTANNVGDGNWAVLGAEDGKLLITTKTDQGDSITFVGQDGYTKGIATLNTAASAYRDEKYADGTVRSIKIDDINRVTGYVDDNFNLGESVANQTGNTVTYTLKDGTVYCYGTKYPLTETKGSYTYNSFTYWTGNEWKSLETGKSVEIENSAYAYYPQTLTTTSSSETNIGGQPDTEDAYKLLFTSGDTSTKSAYWLASQYVQTDVGVAYFGLRMVGYGLVLRNSFYYSYGAQARSDLI